MTETTMMLSVFMGQLREEQQSYKRNAGMLKKAASCFILQMLFIYKFIHFYRLPLFRGYPLQGKN